VKFVVPVAVGVPEIAPVVVFNVMPVGSDPELRDHVSGATPPVVAGVAV